MQPDVRTQDASDAEPAVDRAVAVIGLGYVGLPTALGLYGAGTRVLGVDTDALRLAAIRAGQADLVRAEARALAAALAGDGFVLTADAGQVGAAEAVLICVQTPVDEHRTPDLTALRAACAAVVAGARAGQLVVLTSTAMVGATRDLLVTPLAARGLVAGRDVHVAFSPERIDPGRPEHPAALIPRVVGGVTEACTRRAGALLARLTDAGVHAVRSPEVAELVKLHENTFRAVNLALANELADISRAFGIDPAEVVDAAATKPFGYLAHLPGPGVGGHCIPCDPHYLLWQLRQRRVPAPLTELAMAGIAARPGRVVERVVAALSDRGRGLRGARVAVAGVSYKPGVADLRGSPALEIIAELAGRGADVSYWDPLVPRLRAGGRDLSTVARPGGADYDLVLLHTLHPGGGYDWVRWCPIVLDATYRWSGAPHREVV
jgi:UDP-N-acetyl-D-glucosamine dehydrogenase